MTNDTLDNPVYASATQLARALDTRAISCTELLEQYRQRFGQVNSALNAIIHTDWDSAFKQARALDKELTQGRRRGLLHGIPMTVKEAIDVAGMPSTWGLAGLRQRVAVHDAPCVERLKHAGAVIFGKTNVPAMVADFQTFNPVYGQTNNPWDLDRTPGGSSGGSAAALAAGLTGLELGTDIAGSLRHPAHCCGVYGHRPTQGIVPMGGHHLPGEFLALDMCTIGPMARSAQDLDAALAVLAGAQWPYSQGWDLRLPRAPQRCWSDLRVAILYSNDLAPVDSEVQNALHELEQFLITEGAHVTVRTLPITEAQGTFSLFVQMLRSATAAQLSSDEYQDWVDQMQTLPENAQGYLADTIRGRTLSHRDWLLLANERARLKQQWREFFDDYDFLLCPVSTRAASPHDTVTARHDRTFDIDGMQLPASNDMFWLSFSSLFGLPCTVVPIGFTDTNLPIGVQIIGPWFSDGSTISFGRELEEEFFSFSTPDENFSSTPLIRNR